MNEETTFAEFLNTKLKERGLTLKKLADLSGISLKHLEGLVKGEPDKLPPSPYIHGYIVKLAPLLEFDGQLWWERIRREQQLRSSGGADSLPKNRFAKTPFSWRLPAVVLAVLAVLIYGAFRLPRIIGKPDLTVSSPADSRVTVTDAQFTLQGVMVNGDELSVNDESVPVNADGSWTKNVVLQPGPNPNTFTITAKKSLGRETTIVRQIFFNPPPSEFGPSTAPASSSQSSTPTSILSSSTTTAP